MNRTKLTIAARGVRKRASTIRGISILAVACSFNTACVNVTAPSDPIVIELNVNIKQEVLYRLVASAEENIESNPEIF